MKLIIATILFASAIQANRLLQQAGCAATLCSIDTPECHESPLTGSARCCATDSTCTASDYQVNDQAVCLSNNQRYENRCFGRCEGNRGCGKLCKCQTNTDCDTGYECLETPVGIGGCDPLVADSCFGICMAAGSSCGGIVGSSGCQDTETCILNQTVPSAQPLGSCYSLPQQCLGTPSPVPISCGSIENCALYSNGCNNCDCGIDGTLATPRCTNRACLPEETVADFCVECARGYTLIDGECVPECGGIPYCSNFKPDPCNVCGCGGGGIPFCTLAFCGNPVLFPNECTGCIEGYVLDETTKECVPGCGGIKYCSSYAPDECNTCMCGSNGLEACTDAFCTSTTSAPVTNICTECISGYVLDTTTNECVPGCGGIKYCETYDPDGCNECTCDINTGLAACTKVFCGDASLVPNECMSCQTGYTLNLDTLECEENSVVEPGCFCTMEYDPVCCDGITYGNNCQAACSCTGTITSGLCTGSVIPIDPVLGPASTLPPACAAITCPVGFDCCDNGIGGVMCCPAQSSGVSNKVACWEDLDCDTSNGYTCQNDPECRGIRGRNNPFCNGSDNVCLNNAGRCTDFNNECPVGYTCFGRFCISFETSLV